MKRLLPILLLFLLPLAATAQGVLYQRHAASGDLAVAQVNGFRLNDSVRVDVVIVVADNEEAWQRLKEEYDIRTSAGITSWIGEADHPEHRTRWTGQPACRAVASHARRTIGFYRIDNRAQYEALLEYQIDKMKNEK
ncbi:MAG: hypothetical protein IJ634_04850 [Bacteroidales bacterium]|nr:hypothetical protein [Bacteroidales bacterium]